METIFLAELFTFHTLVKMLFIFTSELYYSSCMYDCIVAIYIETREHCSE